MSSTVEPWFYYREVLPNESLREVVKNYWGFTISNEAPNPFPHRVLPEGSVNLVFCWPRGNSRPVLRVLGPRLDSLVVPVSPGDRYWGVRLQPWATRLALGVPGSELRNQNRALAELDWPWEPALLTAMNAVELSGSPAAVDTFWIERLDQLDVPNHQLQFAVRALQSELPHPEIADIAGRLGVSVRTLQRNFSHEIGIGLKQFARLHRLRSSAVALIADTLKSWASHAVAFGFSDQAHLARESRKVSGLKPSDLLERIRVTSYTDIES